MTESLRLRIERLSERKDGMKRKTRWNWNLCENVEGFSLMFFCAIFSLARSHLCVVGVGYSVL